MNALIFITMLLCGSLVAQLAIDKPYSFEAVGYVNGQRISTLPSRIYYSISQAMWRSDEPYITSTLEYYTSKLQGSGPNGLTTSMVYGTRENKSACATHCINGTVCPCASACTPTDNSILPLTDGCPMSKYDSGSLYPYVKLLADESKGTPVSALCKQKGGHFTYSEANDKGKLEFCISSSYVPIYETAIVTQSTGDYNITLVLSKFSYEEPNPSVFAVPSFCACKSDGKLDGGLFSARRAESHLPMPLRKIYEQMIGFRPVRL